MHYCRTRPRDKRGSGACCPRAYIPWGRPPRHWSALEQLSPRISPLAHLVDRQVDVGGDAHRDREGADAEGVVHDARVLGHLREELLEGSLMGDNKTVIPTNRNVISTNRKVISVYVETSVD